MDTGHLDQASIWLLRLPIGKPWLSFTKQPLNMVAATMASPVLRPHHGPHYYAGFVVDPDGHNIEAVFNSAV